jgi:hypothetical protein
MAFILQLSKKKKNYRANGIEILWKLIESINLYIFLEPLLPAQK